ncbi:MAG TPA: hypothetical protein VGP22_13865 [Albitalea sp.]|jgi:hypothetical protein|nr:hypothetical protein [Albitalea sp.]
MAGPRIWFDPPAFSWGRVVRIGLLWAGLVLVFMLPALQNDPGVPAPAPVAVPAVSLRVAASAPRPPVATRPATVVAAVASAPLRTPAAAGEMPVCGGARLKLRSDGHADLAALAAADGGRVRQRIVSAIRRGGQEWDEAAALFLELTTGARVPPADCEGGNCSDSTRAATTARRLDGLANLALASRDPRLHMLAFNACVWSRQPAQSEACRAVSVERWTQLDPNNAVPWLFLASKAAQKRDGAALADAMQHVAHATHSDSGWGVLPGMVATNAPPEDAAVPATLQLLTEAVGVQTVLSVPSYQPTLEFCKDDALRDPARRQTCGEVAEVLATKSTTLTDRRMGAVLGKRTGWPAERSDSVKTELDAVGQVMGSRIAQGTELLACEGARRSIAYYREVGQVGEIEAARRAIAGSGKSAAAWAEGASAPGRQAAQQGASAPG